MSAPTGRRGKLGKIKQSCTVYWWPHCGGCASTSGTLARATSRIGGEAVFDTTRRPDGVSTEIGDKSRSIVWSSDKEGRGESPRSAAVAACDTLSVLVGGDASGTDAGKYAGDYHVVSGAWRGDQPVYQHKWDDWVSLAFPTFPTSGMIGSQRVPTTGFDAGVDDRREHRGRRGGARQRRLPYLSIQRQRVVHPRGHARRMCRTGRRGTEQAVRRHHGRVCCTAQPAVLQHSVGVLEGFSDNDFAGDYLNVGDGQNRREVYHSSRSDAGFNPKRADWVVLAPSIRPWDQRRTLSTMSERK